MQAMDGLVIRYDGIPDSIWESKADTASVSTLSQQDFVKANLPFFSF